MLRDGWLVEQWDIEAAFLNAPLKHKIYVRDGDEIWELNKALYGLKQSAREWNNEVSGILGQADFEKLVGDEGCYIRVEGRDPIARIASHVDDYLVTAKNQAELNRIRAELEKVVRVDNHGVPQRFLGLECESTQGKIKLTQRLLIEKAAKQFDVKYGAKTPTKSESSINGNVESDLGEHQGEPLADEVKYRQLIGTLTYISRMTRPDVGFPINVLARRNASPSQRNYEAAKRVLQYLWQTRKRTYIEETFRKQLRDLCGRFI
jgi:hypothetical protein